MARRNEAPKPNALVAAAKKISLGVASRDTGVVKTDRWMADSWVCFDEVGEVKHSLLYAGNAMAKLRVFAAARPLDDPDGDPVPVGTMRPPKGQPDGTPVSVTGVPDTLAASAEAEVRRLDQADGGAAELQRVATICFEATGLAYLVGYGARDAVIDPTTGDEVTPARVEQWEMRSDREVEFKEEQGPANTKVRKALLRGQPGGTQVELDSDIDTISAMYQRHAAWKDLPDCNMRAAIVDCRALQLLTGQVLAEAASAMPAQAWTIPNELTFSTGKKPVGDGEPDEGDPLEVAIDYAWQESVEDPHSLSTFRPFIIRGPAEYLKADYLRLIDFKRGGGAELEARIKARVERLARTLNMPVEVVMGHQGTTFANAEQVDQDTFEDYWQPRAEMLCDALTRVFLRPNLIDAGYAVEEVDRVFLWYDAARLVGQPDPEAGADEAHDRFVISDDTYRRVKGFSDDDAPSVLERLVRVGMKRGIFTADISKALLELLGEEIDVEALPTAPPEDGDDPDPDAVSQVGAMLAALGYRSTPTRLPRRSIVAAARPATPSPWGRRMLAVDVDFRTRVLGAAEASMERALERAGNMMRSKSKTRDLVRNVPPRLVCAHLGRSVVADAVSNTDDLLDGAFDALGDQFHAWGANAQGEALDLVGRVVGGWTDAERGALGMRQAGDLDEAWSWLHGQLRSLAAARLFDPDPAAPDLGEFDPTARVPTGMVRQAVARAGGAAGLTTDGGGGAFVSLVDGGTRPSGGIATGQLLVGELRDHGGLIEAWQWVYGPAHRARPFDPHMDLDGLVFESFDDELLANTDSFPPFAYYLPGDHAGCVCDVEPVVVPPEDLD